LHSRRYSINEFMVVSKTIYRQAVVSHWFRFPFGAAVGADRRQISRRGFLRQLQLPRRRRRESKSVSRLVAEGFPFATSVATLATARSKQIAEALQIKDPAADARCTACHAPLHEVPENLRGDDFKISEGVSCESCHGPAENWIRAHTRTIIPAPTARPRECAICKIFTSAPMFASPATRMSDPTFSSPGIPN
jgi:hypothetical protein